MFCCTIHTHCECWSVASAAPLLIRICRPLVGGLHMTTYVDKLGGSTPGFLEKLCDRLLNEGVIVDASSFPRFGLALSFNPPNPPDPTAVAKSLPPIVTAEASPPKL